LSWTRALNLRALVQLNDHQFREAAATARDILRNHPDDPLALGTVSDAELELGHFELAAKAAQQMMDLKPNLPSYSRASYLRWLQGDGEAAKRFVRSAIDSGWNQHDVEPLAWVFVQAATLFWNEGDFEGAEAGMTRALALVPGYPPALVGKARVALARSEPALAADLLRQALAAAPLVETEGLLADALDLLGDPQAAPLKARLLREGLQHDRLSLAAYLAAHDRNPSMALSLIETEREGRGGPYVEDTYAWVLYRLGRLEEAQAASDRATQLGTPDARLLFHAGAIRIARGAVDAGRALVQQALALNPKFDVAGANEATHLLANELHASRAAEQTR